MAEPRFDSTMNDSDSVLWTIERDPALRTTITAIALLDRPPDMERLRARLRAGARMIPRLRQRVVEPLVRLVKPRWVSVGEPELAYHLRRVVAPPPGTLRDLLDLAEPLAMAGFDRARPLWEFTVVEGLEDGRAALIQKVHHSLTDGIGGIKLALLLLDRDREGSPDAEPEALASEDLSAGAMLAETAAATVALAQSALTAGARGLLSFAAATARNPARSLAATAATTRSIARVLSPATARLSPVLDGSSLDWRFDVIDVPLATLTEAAHVSGATVNDAFLAAVTGGLRRYHERLGAAVDRLRMTMPISYRDEEDALGGNRFVPARFAVPVGSPVDPVERMAELGALARAYRAEPALPLTDTLAGALDRLPRPVTAAVLGSMLKGVDFVATNVPGVPFPVYLAGAEVLAEYAFAPTSGAALNIALVSHVDRACIGINVDRRAVTDPDALRECLVEGFDEVASVPTRRTRRAS